MSKTISVAEAVEYFGSVRRLADVLGITTQAIYAWGDTVPEIRAYQLHLVTKGALYHPEIDWREVNASQSFRRRSSKGSRFHEK